MPNYYSQKDPKWGRKRLPHSTATMSNYGCYVASIAMLGQVLPTDLLISSNFSTRSDQRGWIYSSRAAKTAGLVYRGGSSKPASKGWCVGVTRHYINSGFPTHFFLVNAELGLQIDPLDKDPKPEPLEYKCFQYRIFDNVKLVSEPAPVKIPIKAVGYSMDLNSESWHLAEDVKKNMVKIQSNLKQSNDSLRSLN